MENYYFAIILSILYIFNKGKIRERKKYIFFYGFYYQYSIIIKKIKNCIIYSTLLS